jgi:Mg2+/Co2+ transporter CorB
MSALGVLVPSVVVIVLLVTVSAFFSSSEIAIFSLPEEWVSATSADGSPDGRALGALREDPHRLLVTILVGNNLVNIAITSIVTVLVAEFVPPGATVLVATLGASAIILVFGEIVPKSYGLGHAQTWSLRVARPLSAVELLLTPLVVVFDAGTRWLALLVGGDQHIEDQYVDDPE